MSDQSMPEHSGRPADEQHAPQGAQPEWAWQPPAPDGHPPYGHAVFGQPPYGQALYGHTAYGQPPYGQTAYGQAAYGQAAAEGGAGFSRAPFEQPYFVPTAHQQAWSAAQQYPGQPGQQFWTTPPSKPRSHRLLLGSVAAAAATAIAAGGIAVAVDRSNGGSSQQTALNSPTSQNPFGQNGTGQTLPDGNGADGNGFGGNGFGGTVPVPGSGTGGTQTTGQATTAQQVGVVDINTTLDYGQGKAAGTGIVLTSNGEILTNNHVAQDSTAITVTVVSTGKTYTATVVGTDPSDDVSVLQLKDASGLATAKLGDSAKVAVGAAVTAVGNAGGTGGTPTAAPGTVTALNQSLTASDTNGSNAERLTGMIEVSAAIEAGDSGGPLYDNATGSVVGIDTAASAASARFGNGTTTGFAIPIAKALSIADQIESGHASSTVHLGYPAFLGVQLSAAGQSTGAAISDVVVGSAAAKAGLQAGDTVTAVDGTAITSASGLSTALASHKPSDQVRLRYTDSGDQSHTVTVTLGSGPAD